MIAAAQVTHEFRIPHEIVDAQAEIGAPGEIEQFAGLAVEPDDLAARVEHLQRIRDLQDETGGFTAFIAWTFQHENTDLPDVPETYAHEYLTTVAVARLFLDNVDHLQSSWVTQGKKIGQAALAFGCDDMGSILVNDMPNCKADAPDVDCDERLDVSSRHRIQLRK